MGRCAALPPRYVGRPPRATRTPGRPPHQGRRARRSLRRSPLLDGGGSAERPAQPGAPHLHALRRHRGTRPARTTRRPGSLPGPHRAEQAHAPGFPANRGGGGRRYDGFDRRRDGHGQRTRRPGAAQGQPSQKGTLRCRQLCCADRGARGEPAFRPQERRLHRSRLRLARLLRRCRRGHPLPRRDRRHPAGRAGEPAARVGATHRHARGRDEAAPGRCSHRGCLAP